MRADIICGLDIGASEIRALVGHASGAPSKSKKETPLNSQSEILGFVESPTRGFSKGVVSNLSLLSDAIEETISKAEAAAHCKVRKVITNIAGAHIKNFKSRGSVHISDRPSEITEQDIKRCVESAKLIAMSLDREVVHLIPEKFYIDDKIEINDPLGLFGSKLDVDLNIVTSLVSILQNLTKAINLAGYEVEDIIASGVGTALAVFDRQELEEGAILIDVGKDLIEAALFMEEMLKDCFYFPFGSDDLTQALQDKLRIMFSEAEELRIKYGIVSKDNRELFDDSRIVIPSSKDERGPGREDAQSDHKRSGGNWVDSETSGAGVFSSANSDRAVAVSRQEIYNMLFPKVEEIMKEVYKKIEPFLKQKKKLPRIYVVGGVSRMDGFVEAVEEIFEVPVDMGRIRDSRDFHDVRFAGALGLMRYGVCKAGEKKCGNIFNVNSFAGRVLSRIQSIFSEYF
ncbi:MAG: cell division protein FtsA [Candidatus Omnitrophica bacterium]|nr:cell division protein FtsA [Candidatus Omnitrophota bacterium]MBU1932935.1 cell division protein FtsA [Candidatus Omnitrophota bacterium]